MKLTEAIAARERIEQRIARLDLTRATQRFIEGDAYVCPGPLFRHEPRSDNPMMTGRCNICRAFICHTARGWRQCTRAQAAGWGLLCVRDVRLIK